jgi:acetyl esterase/lipase
MPWMYRLVALPFLKANIAVAIVGYRNYPDGNVQDQVDDIYQAGVTLKLKYPHLWECSSFRQSGSDSGSKKLKSKSKSSIGVCLMGHSSGAHIALLLLIQQIENKLMRGSKLNNSNNNSSNSQEKDMIKVQFDSYVGLSGVYNIQHHFDYEAGRGVEEISPMKPACGYSREAFDTYSPALKLQSLMKINSDNTTNTAAVDSDTDKIMSNYIPPMILLHGMDDDVVPFTSTSEAARIIKNCGARHCSEYYLSKTGHADVIMHFMLGGRSKDAIMRWLMEVNSSDDYLSDPSTQEANIGISSKL